MPKLILLIAAVYNCCTVFSAAAQRPGKPFSFKINGHIRNYQGNTVYIHHRWDEKDYTDSATVEQGNFSFQLKSIDPNMYWFTLGREVTAQPNVIFFADKATVNAYLVGDSLASSAIEGGQTQKDYLDYRALGNEMTRQQQKLQSDYTLANQKGDMAAVNKVQLDYQELGAKHIADLKSFVKSHPRSAVSGYIIFKDFNNPSIPIENAEECLTYIDKSIENTKFIKLARKKISDLKGTQIGAKATDFTQTAPDGKRISLSDFKGKYLLVDFWASWCRPCRMENPNVVAAYNRFKDKGFAILGVSLDSNKEQWIAAIRNDNLTWAQVSDLKGGSNDAAILYGIMSIPQNVLIDREGKIIAKNLRGPALEAKLAELMK